MLNRLIIFLIRRKLGVKTYQFFRFTNQKTEDVYFFSDFGLMKFVKPACIHGIGIFDNKLETSNVSLNWLLSKDCEIECL